MELLDYDCLAELADCLLGPHCSVEHCCSVVQQLAVNKRLWIVVTTRGRALCTHCVARWVGGSVPRCLVRRWTPFPHVAMLMLEWDEHPPDPVVLQHNFPAVRALHFTAPSLDMDNCLAGSGLLSPLVTEVYLASTTISPVSGSPPLTFPGTLTALRTTSLRYGDSACRSLAPGRSLQTLGIGGWTITAAGLAGLEPLRLQVLDFRGCGQVSSAGLCHVLRQCHRLQSVDLSLTQAGTAVCDCLAKHCTSLRQLYLSQTTTKLDEHRFLWMARALPELTHLGVGNHSELTDALLRVLAEVGRLQWLDVSACRALTDDGVRSVLVRCPLSYVRACLTTLSGSLRSEFPVLTFA